MYNAMHESENYIWNVQTDCLGEGAFGRVFRGTDKRTGDPVAVKTLKNVNQQTSQETKLLQTLKHRYIIQLLGVEEERAGCTPVIVTELCNGGSLMQFLNDPDNVGGLSDQEFLLVIEHLAGGLEYLKRHDVIHRDVKPDNIMRHMLDDGSTIYKLGDFGTARELPEGQNFTSLHGTEPYLHPHMYKACFFRDADQQFGANTDLWSIGVTLYHIATGLLPFRVYDRSTMLTIFSEMKRNEGIISAVQDRNSGRVDFLKELPETSRLSFGLKRLVTPMIAGLFIHDDHLRQWTFTRYYEEVQRVVSARLIHVFHVHKLQLLKVYVKSDENSADFHSFIREQTEIDYKDQIFFHKSKLVVTFNDNNLPCDGECVFLLNRGSNDLEPSSNIPLVYENLSNFKTKFMSSGQDIQLAYFACRDLVMCKRLMEYQCMVCKYFRCFVQDFCEYSKEELKELRKIYQQLLEKYANTDTHVKILDKIRRVSQTNNVCFIKIFEKFTESFALEVDKVLDNLVKFTTETDFNNKCSDSYLKTVEKELTDMKNLYKNLTRVKMNKQHYDRDKIKIVHCVHTILMILTDKMEPHFEIFVNMIKNWYKCDFSDHLRYLGVLKKHLNHYKKSLDKFERDIEVESDKNMELILNSQKSVICEQKLIATLRRHKAESVDINSLIEENKRLTAQMSDLTLHLHEMKY